ncbi:hypothetical protein Sjap_004267 [Stephania japonica]|uniref:3-hydroxyisobutyryl-CoA hydrolase n=1 Tax=Stephania japonica TaxID=461633 RepID=A0AAP0K2S6_9MAGN
MQGLRALIKQRSACQSTMFGFRALSVQSCVVTKDDAEELVLVEGKASSRAAVLNRTDALNALNTEMVARLKRLYESWEHDPDVGFVVVKGNGRAFCAGGDVVSLYHLMKEGKIEHCKEFFKEAYSFMYLVGTYLKPHVALLNGITMGGGAGISIPGTFRVATNKTVFATPENLIGLHPDAGASFYLSHLPGYIGEYLALTGEKLTGAEMVACGLATHYTDSARIALVEDRLGKLVTDDPSAVEGCLEECKERVYPDKRSVMRRIEMIDKCFSLGTVEEIIDSLESEASRSSDEWCTATLKRLKEVSPLSLKLSLKSIRMGRYQTLDQCLIREYRMSVRVMTRLVSSDFSEWNPPRLDLVSEDMVDKYFTPFGESEPELELPTKL